MAATLSLGRKAAVTRASGPRAPIARAAPPIARPTAPHRRADVRRWASDPSGGDLLGDPSRSSNKDFSDSQVRCWQHSTAQGLSLAGRRARILQQAAPRACAVSSRRPADDEAPRAAPPPPPPALTPLLPSAPARARSLATTPRSASAWSRARAARCPWATARWVRLPPGRRVPTQLQRTTLLHRFATLCRGAHVCAHAACAISCRQRNIIMPPDGSRVW